MTTNDKLQKTVADIRKRFGQDVIFTFADKPLEIERFHSGSIALDIALGGGIPKGRIIEIWGAESSGKCLTADTYLLTEHGLLTVEELFNLNNTPCFTSNKTLEAKHGLINEKGSFEQTTHFTWNNKRPVYEIETFTGHTIKCTHNHPLRVIDEQGYVVWKNAGDITDGDYLVQLRETQYQRKDVMDVDFARFLGYLIADGTLTSKSRVGFTNSDPDICKDFEWLITNYFGLEFRKYSKKKSPDTFDYHVNSVPFRKKLLDEYGIPFVRAAGKHVPLPIRMSGMPVWKSFIKAYVELESYIDPNKSTIVVTSASYTLLHQVQMMLQQFGIMSLLRENYVAEYPDNEYFDLIISGKSYIKYLQEFGFSTTARLKRIGNESRSEDDIITNYDSIPNLEGLLKSLMASSRSTNRKTSRIFDSKIFTKETRVTYGRLKEIIDHFRSFGDDCSEHILNYLEYLYDKQFFFNCVVGVKKLEPVPTFDVVMPETHSFWSNGLISHNTTMCQHFAAEVQKEGGTVAYVDVEHAVDPAYMRAMGINVDELLISQPDTGEQALEIVDSLVRSGAVDLIIVDSVAALVPRVELEGEMGQAHVGLQARLMSQALRKLTGITKQNNVTIVFTNQTRMKIGVTFGNPETTPGGNALKFYASVRMKTTRTGSNKEGGEAVSNKTVVVVKKNKTAPPFKEAEFDIVFGKGIDKIAEVLDFAVNRDLVSKRGAWFEYVDTETGEILFKAQGRANAVAFLEDNSEILEKLTIEVKNAIS